MRKPVTEEEISNIARELGLSLSKDELGAYADNLNKQLESFTVLMTADANNAMPDTVALVNRR